MRQSAGFTLIETIMAIFILSITLVGLISLAAGGFYSVRYARNQIAADALLQESLEYVRNSRDTAIQGGVSWLNWLTTLNVNAGGAANGAPLSQGCYSSNGCIIDPYTEGAKITACGTTCPTVWYYPTQGFYGYSSHSYPFPSSSDSYATTFVRKVTAVVSADSNQITVTATISWLNGATTRSSRQSITVANWRP
jgi:prepilin-type N-terminal cleavage/methylation domain-containing protein